MDITDIKPNSKTGRKLGELLNEWFSHECDSDLTCRALKRMDSKSPDAHSLWKQAHKHYT